MKVFWSIVFALILSTSLDAQRTIHVPSDFPTVQAGIDVAVDGDTVLVAPGTYTENISFKGKNITVTSGASSYDGASATILVGKADGPVVRFDTFEKNTAVLNGFTISGGISRTLANAPGGGVYVNNASPTISNNNIVRNYGCGILALSGASPIIIKNHIADGLLPGLNQTDFSCESPQEIGLGYGGIGMVAVGDVRIESNLIENLVSGVINDGVRSLYMRNNVIRKINDHTTTKDNSRGALAIGLESSLPEQVTLIQNLLYGNVEVNRGPSVNISGLASVANIVEIGNTFYEPQQLSGDLKPSTFENNIFFALSTSPFAYANNPGIACYTGSSELTFRNNLINNTGLLLDGNCPVAGNSNLQVAPLFRDPANGDFREQDSSPTKDAGDINAPQLPSADLAGKNRTVCGKVDMGAYQLHPHPPIALTATPNPVPGGSPVSFTAVLTGNCNVPTGDVTYQDNGNPLGTGALNSAAVATLNTSFLTVGQHTITATYLGDFNFDDSTSNAVVLTVTGLPSTTSLTVQPNPAKAFQPITLTATVTDPFVQVTGTVTFTAGTTVLGTAPLVRGVAAISTSQLGAGTYAVTAIFNATTQFATSSATVQLQVDGTPTTTTLRSLLNPSLFGQRVVFQAFVGSSGGSKLPQGTVTFRDDSVVLGTSALDASGASTVATDTLAVGTHTITATFNGSQDANSSTSSLQQIVNPVQVVLSLTATPSPARLGETIQLRLVGTANSGVPPDGTANFFEGATALGSAPMTAGTATLAISSLPVGRHVLTATYANAATGTAITFASVTVDVLAFDFALSSSGTKLDIPHSGYAEVTLTLTPLGSYDRAVHLSCSDLPPYALCSLEREMTEPLSKGPQKVKLVVNANTVLQYGPHGTSARLQLWGVGGGVLVAGVFCCGFRRRRFAALCALSLFVLFAAQGCSSKSPDSTPAGDYIMTVTGQDVTGQAHSVQLQMHVR